MMTAKEIRQSFLDFFQSKQHIIVPSAPMVIKGDPTLMFTNAGMNQFKNIILGNDPIVYPRVTDTQKCLRVSGKHNDLEEVGHDTYHHTMFEMLGNWSFGDYFKTEAISYAWEYLTEVLKLDKDRLYVTVYEGSQADGVSRDDEAAEEWAKHISPDRIINGNRHDNFWEMGEVGPCGPCSEIHIDLRDDEARKAIDARLLINKDDPQVIEIWNQVFMQYNRMSDGHLEPLPNKVIDTGMGFERLCMAVQGKRSNYDTDVFQPLIKELEKIGSVTYGKDEEIDIAMRVIVDHIRTIAFSIADGQLPSNAKAGYVIRRILRRAVRYGYTFMEQRSAFLYKLLPVLMEQMSEAYPELKAQSTLIGKVVKEEELSFLRTLEVGMHLLEKVIDDTKAMKLKEISGSDAFLLYDTYGFPIDLTQLILKEQGMQVNMDGFNTEMQRQKDRARDASQMDTGDWINVRSGETTFVGYDQSEVETQILRYRKVTQKKKTLFQVVLSVTPFYAEMGGQVGDTGLLIGDHNYGVIDTKRENNLPIHIMKKMPEDVTQTFLAQIDRKRRCQIEANHSATHLLQYVLRKKLGQHVEQKGSFVSPESLRFDFSHFEKISPEVLREIEHEVNDMIRQNIPLDEHREVPIEEAKEMGAMALFGEKYGHQVRVIRYGDSIELCGGTHVKASGCIGMVKIISESSIASGIRRIEAITGEALEKYMDMQSDMTDSLRFMFNNTQNIVQSAQKTLEEQCALRKEVERYLQDRVKLMRERVLDQAAQIGDIKVSRLISTDSPDMIKGVTSDFRGRFADVKFAFIAGVVYEGKPNITLFLSQPLVDLGLHAGKIVKAAAKYIQGGGGGQPFLASAGGKYANGVDEAVDYIMDRLKEI